MHPAAPGGMMPTAVGMGELSAWAERIGRAASQPLVWGALIASAGAIVAALHVHTRVRGWLPEDWPGTAGRKQHQRVTPMVGILPALVATTVCAIAEAWWLAGAVAVAGAVGGVDDYRKDPHHGGVDPRTGKKVARDGLRWQTKTLGLAVAAGLGVAELAVRAGPLDVWSWIALPIALFCITNAVNFLDNTDGVAAGLGVTGLVLVTGTAPATPAAELDVLALALAATWLGFLPFNWPRARVFLGDAGALSLGAALGTLALLAATSTPGRADALATVDAVAALAPVAIPAVDFAQVVAVRLALGLQPWVGDRRHLTHVANHRLRIPPRWIAPTFVALAVGAWWLVRSA